MRSLLPRFAALALFMAVACGDSTGDKSDVADDAGTADDDAEVPDTSTTSLTGTLGALGEVQPIVSSFFITNSGETIVYMSTAELTCELLMKEGGRWLGSLPSGSQVVEIVFRGTPKVGTVSVDHVEINYAPGGKSSSYEKNAHSGDVRVTKSTSGSVVEGVVNATYTGPQGNVTGTFHAEFCPGGQEY